MWQNTKGLNTNVTKCKKTEYKYDKMQKDKIQRWQDKKVTKYKKTIRKYDKTQMWQYAKRQNTNMT